MNAQSEGRTHAHIKRGPRLLWSRHLCFSILLLLCCLLVLSACSKVKFSGGGLIADDNTTATPAPTPVPTKAVTPTPAYVPQVINLSVVNCPALNVNWDTVAGTKPNVNKVQTVTCGYFGPLGYGALVNVRSYAQDAKLDVYVFTNIYGAPNKLPVVSGLINGDALISVLGTVGTAEAGVNDQFLTRDVYKEYQWNGSGFSQVAFPGIFPDASMYQAILGQRAVNADLAAGKLSGGNLWRIGFKNVAEGLALKLFKWQPTQVHWYQPPGGYSNTGTSVSQIVNLGTGGGGFTMYMYRVFGGNAVSNYNVMEIKQVVSFDGTIVLNSPSPNTLQQVSGGSVNVA